MNSLPQVLCLPQILGWTHPPCGSELAHEYGVSVADEVSGLTPSRASSLPHWFCIQNNSVWRLLNLYGSELPRQRRALICCDRFSAADFGLDSPPLWECACSRIRSVS